MPSGTSGRMMGGRAVGRASALGMAGMPARGVAGIMPAAAWVASRPGPALFLEKSSCLSGQSGSTVMVGDEDFVSLAQESVVVLATAVMALPTTSQAAAWGWE